MYRYDELVKIAKRENNPKRNYLVVNPSQGKHIPVSPKKALGLFSELAGLAKDRYEGERLLVVGFAETATAIGSQVAATLKTAYIQTTREIIPGVEYLFFSEEHSHATEQKLVKTDIDAVADKIDRIMFVEDEVTTGKTILNIIDVIKRVYDKSFKFSVLSLLNGMNEENLLKYREADIDIMYLQKIDNSGFTSLADTYKGDGKYIPVETGVNSDYRTIEFNGCVNARRITDGESYETACEALYEKIKANISSFSRILVMGTEECMFPALYVGSRLEENATVMSHSTTRSPITVSTEAEYPVHARFELKSLYDDERRTFIYDIGKYDLVLVVTDSDCEGKAGVYSLMNALSKYNENILLVRWRK